MEGGTEDSLGGGWAGRRRGGGGDAFGGLATLRGGGERGAVNGMFSIYGSPTRVEPTACTLALWWLKLGPTKWVGGGIGVV